MSSALLRVSRALDSKDIREVLVSLEGLPDDVEDIGAALEAFLYELMTWDLKKNREVASAVVRQLLGLQKNLQEKCVQILKSQPAVAVQIAVEIMMRENWKLSVADCQEVWNKIEMTKPNANFRDRETVGREVNNRGEKAEEYVNRVTANSQIFRASGAPQNLLRGMLLDSLLPLNHLRSPFPLDFLCELSIFAPFHPFLDIEEAKNQPDVFLIPQCMSSEYRFRQGISEFISFVRGPYQSKHARPLFSVLLRIFERMERIELLQAEDIDLMINLWMTSFKIFNGDGISMENISKAAKLIERTAARFELKRSPLFLKRFLQKFAANKCDKIVMEPQIVAVIISTFQRLMCSNNSPFFFDELGDFYTYFNILKYGDVYNATAFFSAVFAIAKAQALFKVKPSLCAAVYEEILKPMHTQIADFQKGQELKERHKDKMSPEEQAEMEREKLGADMFTILICTYQQAEEAIQNFINN